MLTRCASFASKDNDTPEYDTPADDDHIVVSAGDGGSQLMK